MRWASGMGVMWDCAALWCCLWGLGGELVEKFEGKGAIYKGLEVGSVMLTSQC